MFYYLLALLLGLDYKETTGETDMEMVYIVFRSPGFVEGVHTTYDSAIEHLQRMGKSFDADIHVQGNCLYVYEQDKWVLAAHSLTWPLTGPKV